MASARGEWRVGAVRIQAPEPGNMRFWIHADIAEMLACDYTSDALARFRSAYTARVAVDAEADGVTFSAGRDAIVEIARVLNDLAVTHVDRDALAEQLAVARREIRAYLVSLPIAWKVGDCVALELRDGTHAYGQVVAKTARTPSCLLVDHRTLALETGLGAIGCAILHVSDQHLATGEWTIIAVSSRSSMRSAGHAAIPSRSEVDRGWARDAGERVVRPRAME